MIIIWQEKSKYLMQNHFPSMLTCHFRLDFIMEANSMDPYQTAQYDLGPYCLQYRLRKNISRD